MRTALLVALAVGLAVVTLLLCDQAGSTARAKGRSYWLFFALGLLLWFPALLAAHLLPVHPSASRVGRGELAVGGLVTVLALAAAVAAIVAALQYAP